MKRFASVRFGGVLDASERDAVTRGVRSAGAAVRSWKTSRSRTYVTLAGDQTAIEQAARTLPAATVDVPALAVLRIVPDASRTLGRLFDALGGAGCPDGVRHAYRDGDDALVVETDTGRTSLAFVVALIDAELAAAPGRRIEALVALDDAALAAFAGDVLGAPDLTASRVIESHLEALLAEAGT